MESPKKISILVPCCNVEQYVRECLESIKNQTFRNLEVICIDDGSKDSTGSIIDEFVAKDQRFKVIHKPNSGYGDSMNKGLDMCSGDYVGIIESDDWIEPDMFETLFQTAEEHNLDLVRCTWYEGPTGTENINSQDFVKKNVVINPLDTERVFLQQPSIWAALYRVDLLESDRKIRFLPTPGASYQDASFAFKCYTKSKRHMMIDKPLHHYRINPNSSVMSAGKPYCIVDEWEEIYRWVCEDTTLRNRFSQSSILAQLFYEGLFWNYNRLSITSLRLSFLRKASNLFRRAKADGILNLYNFKKEKGGKAIQLVIEDPLTYYKNSLCERLDYIAHYKDYIVDTQNQQDLISVIVTCYNTSKYIFSCLLSICQQSYKNIEILCVDDCSTDDTKIQVRHLMRKDDRIVWLCTNENKGLSACRNLGIEHAQGKYIIFVDGDDCLLPGAISRLYSAIGNNDLVCGSATVAYEGGEYKYSNLVDGDKIYYINKKCFRLNAIENVDVARKLHVSAWAKLWRTSVIKKYQVHFPEGLLFEDACFYWQYLCVAPIIQVIKEPVYLYQRHPSGSIMTNTFNQRPGLSIQHILILDTIYSFACKWNLTDRMKVILNKLYAPYFWFAYSNSPASDYKALFENMSRILKEQEVDTSESPLLNHLSHYHDYTKEYLFIEAFQGEKEISTIVPPAIHRLNKKLKKYRHLTRLFMYLSIALLLTLLIILFHSL